MNESGKVAVKCTLLFSQLGYISIEGSIYDSLSNILCDATESGITICLHTFTSSASISCALAPANGAARKAASNIDFSTLTLLHVFLALLATVLETGYSRLIVEQLGWAEETVNLYKCILNRVRCVNHVLLTAH